MTKRRILLSGLGGSLFPYLHEKLKDKYELYYVDADASLKAFYPSYNFFPAPLVTHSSYPAFIKDIVDRYSIELYVPLIDEEIEVAHHIRNEIPSLELLSPTLDFCKMAMRKDLLMKALSEAGISRIGTWTGDQFIWKNGSTYFVK